MKKTLLKIFAGILAFASMPAVAQITRDGGLRNEDPAEMKNVRVLPEGFFSKTKQSSEAKNDGPIRGISSQTATPKTRKNVSKKALAKTTMTKVASKATSLTGYLSYTDNYSADRGWYNVKWPSSSFIWKQQTQFTPTAGFTRDGSLYAFYTYATTSNGLTDAGLYVLDVATGAAKSVIPFDIFDGYQNCVTNAVYDPQADVAYVVTRNKDANGFILQKFDPKTFTFTNLGVNVPSDWLAFGWSPVDSTIYMIDESGILKRYDSKSKKFVQAGQFSYDLTDYSSVMTYSPKDEGFIFLAPSWEENEMGEAETLDALLVSLTGKATYLGTMKNDEQWTIFECGDTYVNATAPGAPTVSAINISGAALSGNIELTLPSKLENGNAISGKVYVEYSLDGTLQSGTYSGNPGEKVTIPVSAAEGSHRLIFTPYLLGDDGKLYGSALILDRYFGNDVPAAPAAVTLTETKVSWQPVTSGANNGYINAADVKYNVYVDDQLMNAQPVSGTSLDITMPANGVVGHVAKVTAVIGDKVSQPGISSRFYADGPLSLPVRLVKDEDQADMDADMINLFTIVKDPLNTDELRGWRYDDQSERTGGFYCLAPKVSSKGDIADEWLFLPAINFPDKDKFYKFTMDVWSANHYFTKTEKYEVTLTQRPSASRPTVIRGETQVLKNKDFETSETVFQVPEAGDWYIGIHYISPLDSYRLYARDFRVEEANSTADAPAEVTELEATAAERGELKANLTFKMPSVSVSGAALADNSEITATATTAGGSASVKGKPGQAMTLAVPTLQGENRIKVTTSSSEGNGKLAETVVYTGVYRPGIAIVDKIISDDNQKLTLKIELDDYNENDEWAGADACDVTIYRRIGSEWRAAAEIGKDREWTFDCPDPTVQDSYEFGVAAHNAAGYCETMTTLAEHLGKVHILPMKEEFTLKGGNPTISYEPITFQHLSYLPGDWGFCNPSDIDDAAANQSGIAVYATWESETQLNLPKFSTKGLHNAKVELGLFFGDKTPERITVYATSPSVIMEPVASFTRESGSGWDHKIVSLPSSCQDKGWVQIQIRVNLVGYSQTFLLESYAVANYPEEMITITGINGPSKAVVGETNTYRVDLLNAGVKDAAVPDYEFTLLGDNGVIGNLTAIDAPATITPGKSVTLNFAYTAKAADMGDVLARFSISGQPVSSVSEIDKEIKVLNAALPVVSDLKATVSEDETQVALTWSPARLVENFESCDPWDYSETLRGFSNLDLDGNNVWSISEVSYPTKNFPKAYMVFSDASTDNKSVEAHSGEQYLIGMSSSRNETDDWLISPEVKPGSEFSFWMNICDAQYPEILLVKYSTTGNATRDFKDLEGGYVCPDKTGWQQYSFKLPADAKYFALHHTGDDGQEQFGLMIDDISYDPANPTAVMKSYNLYRDDALIASGLQTPGYVDTDIDLSVPHRYYVKTLGEVNGENVESDRSNVVWAADSSEVEGIASSTSYEVSGAKGAVICLGFEIGTPVKIVNTSAMSVYEGNVESTRFSIELPAGIYIVSCGNAKAKVIVR